MGLPAAGGVEFVESDFLKRNAELLRQHFVHGIQFLHPARRRIHGADAGGVYILGEIDFDACGVFPGKLRRDFVHQPAIALLVGAQHFHMRALLVGARAIQNIGELRCSFWRSSGPSLTRAIRVTLCPR